MTGFSITRGERTHEFNPPDLRPLQDVRWLIPKDEPRCNGPISTLRKVSRALVLRDVEGKLRRDSWNLGTSDRHSQIQDQPRTRFPAR